MLPSLVLWYKEKSIEDNYRTLSMIKDIIMKTFKCISEVNVDADLISRHTYLLFLGYVVSLQARSCNKIGFPSFFYKIVVLD